MVFGKIIKLFLVDGTPNKRWICELSNWTGIAYKLPRNMVKESENRSELASPGVYFLFGHDDDNDRPRIVKLSETVRVGRCVLSYTQYIETVWGAGYRFKV